MAGMAADGIHDLPLVGGHLGLDLVNTLEPRFASTAQREHLTTPAALLEWAARAGVVDEAASAQVADEWRTSAPAGSHDLMAVLALREQLYAAVVALLEARTPDLAAISAAWASAASRASLQPGADGVQLLPAVSIPDRLAFAAVDLLTHLDLTRLRACPPDAGGCGWLFLDHSRNNSRRWCVMADCGTQAKSRKLTARRRSDRVGTSTSTSSDSD